MEMTVLGVLKMENIQEEDRVKVERIHSVASCGLYCQHHESAKSPAQFRYPEYAINAVFAA